MKTLQTVLAAALLASLCAAVSAQTTLTQSTDPNTVVAGSVACGNISGQGDNSYYRIYTAASIFTITAVRFGVEVDYDAPSNLSLRFWNVAATTATTFTLGAQIGATTTFTTPGNSSWNGTIRTIALNASIQVPPGQFAVEVFQANNQPVLGNFFLGSNGLGESGPTYLRAPLCGVNTPTTVGSLVAGSIHYIIDVVGYLAPAIAPDPEVDVRFPSGPRNTIPSAGTASVGPLPPSVATNVQVEVANQGGTANLTLTAPQATAPVNCTIGTITAPASVAAGTQGVVQVPVTPAAGIGTWSFTLTIPNNDANEGNYVITVQGTRGMSGSYTVGAGQTYADLGLAFNDLEQFGVVGAVTLSVAAGTYTPSTSYALGSNGFTYNPVRGLSATNTLTITRANATAQVVISGAAAIDPSSATTGCMSVFGCSFVTIDGLTFANGGGFGLRVGHDSFETGQATNITVRNCKAHTIGSGPGIAVVNDSRPLANVLIQNCMVWECAAGNTVYGMNLPGAIAVFLPGINTVIEHCTVVNSTGATSVANVGRPGAIGYAGPAIFEALRVSPTIRNCVLVADGTDRPCIWFPNDDGGAAAPFGPYPPTAANRNVYFTQNSGLVATSGLTGTAVQTFATLGAWQTAFPALDANSIDTNPNLSSAVDLHLTAASPAIGLAVGSTLTSDIDGDVRPQGAAPDAGADEYFPGPGLSVIATDTAAAEATPATETGTYTLTFVTAPTVSVTVNFTMSGSASSSPGTDYVLTSPTPGVTLVFNGPGGTITVPAATGSVVVILTPIDDVLGENSESAIFTIDPGAGYTVGAPSGATVTIADNEPPVIPVITVSSAGSPAEAGTVQGTFTLTATPAPATPVNVTFSLAGAAALNTDYIASSSTSVQIPVTGSATVTITPIDDTQIEIGGESVVITLAGGAGYTVGSPDSALLVIGDDDFPVVTISATGTPSETGPAVGSFTLTATPAPPSNITVYIQYSGGASQPGDYSSSAGNSVVIGTSGTVSFNITPVDDVDIETGGEDVTVTIVSAPPPPPVVPQNYVIGTPSQATLNIADNDFTPVVIPGPTPIVLLDGTFNIPYTANLSASGGNGTFNWSVAAGSSLPTGLSIANASQANAQISGTPGAAGTFNFTLECTDGLTTASHDYTLFIASGSITSGGGSGGSGGNGCAAGIAGPALAGLLVPALTLRRRRRA